MKVSYYGYFLHNQATGKKVLFDIRPLLRAFTKSATVEFKNQFTHQGEHIYLLPHTVGTYLFIITRSKELIRKINTESLSIGDVNTMLTQDEQIGFASYVLFKEDHFAFGSTLLAPKVDVLCRYISDLIESLGVVEWQFIPKALLYQTTREEALKMDFVGRTTITLDRENSLARDFIELVTGEVSGGTNLDGIEITFKPKPRKSIKNTVDKFIENASDEGVKRMIMKAKSETMSHLVELYVAGKGGVSDSIDGKVEQRIAHQIEKKMAENTFLPTQLREFKDVEDFESDPVEGISRYCTDDAWSSLLSNLQRAPA